MVRIRLTRVGKKGQPSYRVVVVDSRKKRDGAYIENIGYYDPLVEPAKIKVKEDRALYWLSQGAQPSQSVRQLFTKQGIMKRFVENQHKSPQKHGEDLAMGGV
ncbi:MAG: 30S ribosomal protein S16 [Thermotoga sp.]|nr:30S ribosomal protein S16 [Thermotogota bacterium]RKX52929.1 MAG: 30S ribosomal protein S16 [Thermotoga sp.]